jgi:hypothetical protein
MKIRYVGKDIESMMGKKSSSVRVAGYTFTPEQARDFEPIFRFLNEKDRDILYLIFISQKKQNAVEKIMDRSQPMLCYDIRRIRKRLQFICYLHSVFDIFFEFLEERAHLYEPEIIEILTLMFYTTSLTQTAVVLGTPQIRVRYRFDKALQQMADLEHWDVYEIFLAIKSNLNIVRRVYSSD